MSQLSQQAAERPFDTQLHYLPQESPTAGRTQLLHSANNSSPVLETHHRFLRKATSSPLQTSTTPTSPSSSVTPTRTTFPMKGSDDQYPFISTKASQSPLEEPRSPKERLDDLLATEKNFYTSDQSAKSPQIQGNSRYLFNSCVYSTHSLANRYDRPLQEANLNAPIRSVSNPVLVNLGQTSPTGKPPTMAATTPAHRVEMGRPPPRNSSIDSAISSISSGGHSYKNSQDSKGSSAQFDVAQLIQAAGSPEAAIQYLIKEKQAQTGQNSQLWRLVDKQRAMILGLNKDLERALKDKERYRKKLKENLTQHANLSPVDSTQGPMSESGSVTSESRVTEISAQKSIDGHLNSDRSNDGTHSQHSPIDVATAPYPITTPTIEMPALSNMAAVEHKMPSPTKHAFQQYVPDSPPLGFEASQLQRKNQAVVTDIPYNIAVPPSRGLPSDSPRGPPPTAPPPPPISSQGPPSAIVESSSKVDRGSPKFPPPRKAPPAPLNLGKKTGPSIHLRKASETKEESDSDYDDILEVDEIPTFTDRGRRKTREEDDRVREIAAAQDAEARSLSKKSSKGNVRGTPKSTSTTPKELVPAMPLSARPTVPISPPDGHLRALSPPDKSTGSLAGMLSASRSLPTNTTLMAPPLMSPGLPQSPRPIAMSSRTNLVHPSMASPPLSSRGMGAFSGSIPLSPRAPRQPIPLPPGTPMSIGSPLAPRAELLVLASPQPLVITKKSEETLNTLKSEETLVNESVHERRQSESPTPSHFGNVIYKGLVTEEYPDLLLPPNALPSIDVRVASSRLKPSRATLMFPANLESDPVFTLAVFARSDGKELWRVEKDSASLVRLDQILKKCPTFTARTPDKYLFSGHSPAKIDDRRTALDNYLDEVLNTELDTESALEICRYLSSNTMEPHADDLTPGSDTGSESPVKTGPGGRPLKNGYLTKKGKNFGGWKARFFVLDGPVFKYYESPGGPHLGTIKLQSAQIGKQSQPTDGSSPSRGDTEDVDNQYRHAFLILEPKRKDSSSLVRHVLCAESDKERDEWVEALLRYVDYKDENEHYHSGHTHSGTSGSHPHGRKGSAQGKLSESGNDLRAVGYDTIQQGAVPHGSKLKNSGTPSPPTHGRERDPMSLPNSQSMKSISGPKNAYPIQDAGSWGNKSGLSAPDEKIKQKKRSFFGFGSRPRPSADLPDQSVNMMSNHNLSQMAYDQHGPIRPVFGTPLTEAVRYNHPADVQIELPAVLYRCIEYLDAKNAAGEEGIFRLSGSNVVIRQLRERFNVEGDVNLVTDDQYYDIHAVASLLKLYLRELPTTILTRELHLEFIAVTELRDINEKISALNGLVHRLPRANNILLRYLAGFLINIINHSDINKMTVRNVGIVFSPTLNIPAPVFALFLQQYDGIFEQEPNDHERRPIEVTVTAPALSPEDIRSPRRQKFQQDLPTPSFNQQSFGQQGPGFAGFNTMAGPEYGSRSNALGGISYDQQYSVPKTKRRESNMFTMGMGLGQKKSTNRLKENDPRLVDEESFFD
ncbi:Rho GTPase activating protein [Ciborinia camelliae]|nr:Rho GTPase activating protein [Ciborinia camelliae]